MKNPPNLTLERVNGLQHPPAANTGLECCPCDDNRRRQKNQIVPRELANGLQMPDEKFQYRVNLNLGLKPSER